MPSDSLTQLTVEEFLRRLASNAPTPGGGSVAALAGALAAALGHMVTAFTLGKPRFAAVEAEVTSLAQRFDHTRIMLQGLIDEDVAAFGELNATLRLKPADPQRGPRVAGAARVAASVPLEVMAIAARIANGLERLGHIGNPLLRSDVDAGLHMARAALHAAAANVRANLPLMDPAERAALEVQLTALEAPPTLSHP